MATSVSISDPYRVALVPECPECGPSPRGDRVILDSSGGKFVCTDCGIVVGDRLITDESEWRTFSSDHGAGGDDRNRVGGPDNPLFEDRELTTGIAADPSNMNSVLGKWQSLASGRGSEKTIIEGFSEIGEFGHRMDLSDSVQYRAKEIFKQMHETKKLRGRPRNLIVTACLFIACQGQNVDRSRKEFCRITDVDLRDLGRVIQKIQKHMKSVAPSSSSSAYGPVATARPQKPSAATAYLNRFCALLNLKQSFISAVSTVVRRVEAMGIMAGRNPATLACACIYLVSVLKPETRRNISDIADVAAIAASTIRLGYRSLHPYRHSLIPKAYADESDIESMPSS
ncbi:Transcription initiation factor IIB [Plasmodiophora brassicae]